MKSIPYIRSAQGYFTAIIRDWAAAAATARAHIYGAVSAANDDEVAAANAFGGEAAFEVQQGSRLFVPYGEYLHAVGLQKFDKASGNALVAAFNSLGSKVSRFFTKAGVPIYRGHPDVPGRPDSNPSAPALGWVEGITAENEGIALDVKWNADGEAAIGGAQFRFYSPHWLLSKVKGGLAPSRLLSIGLTNNPRIPVPAIANDKTNIMNPKLLELLGLANDADETAISAAVTAFIEKATNAANDLTTRTSELATANGLLATRTTELTAANDSLVVITRERDEARTQLAAANDARLAVETERTAANDRVTALRTRIVDDALPLAVTAGRVLPAEKDAKRTELLAAANDTDLFNALGALAALPQKLKTTAVTKSLGAARSAMVTAANDEPAMRQSAIREAVGAELAGVKKDHPKISDSAAYDMATGRARAKSPQLFA